MSCLITRNTWMTQIKCSTNLQITFGSENKAFSNGFLRIVYRLGVLKEVIKYNDKNLVAQNKELEELIG